MPLLFVIVSDMFPSDLMQSGLRSCLSVATSSAAPVGPFCSAPFFNLCCGWRASRSYHLALLLTCEKERQALPVMAIEAFSWRFSSRPLFGISIPSQDYSFGNHVDLHPHSISIYTVGPTDNLEKDYRWTKG